MSNFVKIPNKDGHMAIRRDQITRYYDVGVAHPESPDHGKGPRVKVYLIDGQPRTFFMTAEEFGKLLEPKPSWAAAYDAARDPTTSMKDYRQYRGAGGYQPDPDPADRPIRVTPIQSEAYVALATILERDTNVGLTIEGAAMVAKGVRDLLDSYVGQYLSRTAVRQHVRANLGMEPDRAARVYLAVESWVSGGLWT